jgi:hypothetical protein
LLANPGGTGPNYGQQSLDRDAFSNRGPFSAVVIEVAAAGRTFKVAHTDGQGARLRSQPDANSPPITSLAEGTLLSGDEHAWRRVTTADGTVGWVAEEFLSSGQ